MLDADRDGIARLSATDKEQIPELQRGLFDVHPGFPERGHKVVAPCPVVDMNHVRLLSAAWMKAVASGATMALP